jgi:tRNA U54 and U55 pseudouridine synthase Pus10
LFCILFLSSRLCDRLGKADKEAILHENAREVAQVLLNALFQLPVISVPDVGAVVELPTPTAKIPREKPVTNT